MCAEVVLKKKKKGLIINKDSYERFYTANLWSTIEVANRDAVIIFYNIVYDNNDKVVDAEFNFVEKREFERTYSIIT